MTRNLSLIPTIEAEPEDLAESPAHSPAGGAREPIVVLAGRRRVSTPRANRGRASPRTRSARSRWREIGNAAFVGAGIAVLFLAVAWPLYLWIGK